MFLTLVMNIVKKPGWKPRSVGVPGKQWIGKNRRVRGVTRGMLRNERKAEARILGVEAMIEFPFLTAEEAVIPGRQEQLIADQQRLLWQSRHLGADVFGLGLGKPSPLDHLNVTDTKRYDKDGSVKEDRYNL